VGEGDRIINTKSQNRKIKQEQGEEEEEFRIEEL